MSEYIEHDLDQVSVGLVRRQGFTFAVPPDEMQLERGARLGPVTLVYETYGTLAPDRRNAVLVLHALSGDAHAAGIPLEGRIIQTVLRRPTFFLFVLHSHLMPLPAAIASSRRSGDDALPTGPGRCAQARACTPHAPCRRHIAQ